MLESIIVVLVCYLLFMIWIIRVLYKQYNSVRDELIETRQEMYKWKTIARMCGYE